MGRRWNAVLGRIGTPTGDRRIIAPGALTTRDLPLPLMWQRMSGEGHGGAVTVATIEELTIDNAAGVVTGSGRILDVRGAADAERQMEAGVTGPSLDLFDDIDITEVQKVIEAGVVGPDLMNNFDDVEYVIDENDMVVITSARIAGATLVQIPAFADVYITLEDADVSRETSHGDMPCDPATEDCSPITNYALIASVRSSGWSDMPLADESRDWDGDAASGRVFSWATDGDTTDWGRYARAFLRKDDDADPQTRGAYSFGIADVVDGTLTIVPRGVFAAAAAVQGARTGSEPAEADAMRSVLNGIYARLDREPPWGDGMQASANVSRETLPPLEWFARPDTVGPVTVDGDRVYGYLAEWGTCHVGLPGCTTAPHSYTNYAHFLRKPQVTSTGETVPVGVITVGGGHADPKLGLVPALAHYDDVGSAVAKVNAGEDEFGIWVAGYVLPYADPVKVQQLADLDVSGDWRTAGGNLELVALCAVNTPGFPVLRKVHFSLERGGQQTLIGQFKVEPRSDVSRETSPDDSARARWHWANTEV